MGPIANELTKRLTDAFQPTRLEVIDESAGHRGHSGFDDRGESHIRVVITAPSFAGLSRIERVRAVQRVAGDLVTSGRIHAFSVDARAA